MLGVIAATSGIIFSLGVFVQTYKIIRLKNAKEVSLITFGLALVNAAIWIAYGIQQHDLPIVIPNIVLMAGTISVITATLYYNRKSL